ncbi:hypothetical protein ABVK25_011461 [Lepraria finkii]|uniref:Uncharacterized protein n=1 Tax=Lepraria finkii TaxID=1340010 RepID=A0ABR4AP58_9LECA
MRNGASRASRQDPAQKVWLRHGVLTFDPEQGLTAKGIRQAGALSPAAAATLSDPSGDVIPRCFTTPAEGSEPVTAAQLSHSESDAVLSGYGEPGMAAHRRPAHARAGQPTIRDRRGPRLAAAARGAHVVTLRPAWRSSGERQCATAPFTLAIQSPHTSPAALAGRTDGRLIQRRAPGHRRRSRPLQRQPRCRKIRQAARAEGIPHNGYLFSGIANDETGLAMCWSGRTWACKGPRLPIAAAQPHHRQLRRWTVLGTARAAGAWYSSSMPARNQTQRSRVRQRCADRLRRPESRARRRPYVVNMVGISRRYDERGDRREGVLRPHLLLFDGPEYAFCGSSRARRLAPRNTGAAGGGCSFVPAQGLHRKPSRPGRPLLRYRRRFGKTPPKARLSYPARAYAFPAAVGPTARPTSWIGRYRGRLQRRGDRQCGQTSAVRPALLNTCSRRGIHGSLKHWFWDPGQRRLADSFHGRQQLGQRGHRGQSRFCRQRDRRRRRG